MSEVVIIRAEGERTYDWAEFVNRALLIDMLPMAQP